MGRLFVETERRFFSFSNFITSAKDKCSRYHTPSTHFQTFILGLKNTETIEFFPYFFCILYEYIFDWNFYIYVHLAFSLVLHVFGGENWIFRYEIYLSQLFLSGLNIEYILFSFSFRNIQWKYPFLLFYLLLSGKQQLCTVRKMNLILRPIERRPQMQFSIARRFRLKLLRRYSVKFSKMRNITLGSPGLGKLKNTGGTRTNNPWICSLRLCPCATVTCETMTILLENIKIFPFI